MHIRFQGFILGRLKEISQAISLDVSISGDYIFDLNENCVVEPAPMTCLTSSYPLKTIAMKIQLLIRVLVKVFAQMMIQGT